MEPIELKDKEGYRIGYRVRVLFNKQAWLLVKKPKLYQKTKLVTSQAERELSEFLKDKVVITLKSKETN